MNISGILLSKKKIEMLNGKQDLTKELLKNLDVFNRFDWSKFKKDVFFDIVSALDVFLKKYNIADNQEFVIFYQTDITEMDCATVMLFGDKQLFINFEIKNGNEEERLENSLKLQLEKRKNEYIPQLFKNSSYLLIGILNNQIKMSYFSYETDSKWLNDDELEDKIKNVSYYNSVENYLYQVNNMASIVNIFHNIENGSFKYYEETKRISEAFILRLQNNHDEKGIICYGHAGCGKSVLALKLFNEIQESKILILNPKLYFTLNMEKYYMSGKASYKPDELINEISDNDIIIVDEAQRLRESQIIDIVKKAKKVIFFGDERQSFKRYENLFTAKELMKFINDETGCKFHIRKLTKSRRYSDEVAEIIENLTSNNPHKTKVTNDYNIEVICSVSEFLNKYDSSIGNKKMYVPFTVKNTGEYIIGDRIFEIAGFDVNGFSAYENYNSKYIGHTMHALSFDVEDAFVYIPNVFLVKSDRKNKLFKREINYDSDDVIKFMNELNILFSRGRKNLYIYVDDINVYLYLKSRLPK